LEEAGSWKDGQETLFDPLQSGFIDFFVTSGADRKNKHDDPVINNLINNPEITYSQFPKVG